MTGTYATTRHSLHGLAELVLAGPRYATGGSMRLRSGADGIRTWDDPPVRLARGELVAGSTRVPLDRLTYAAAAAAIELGAHPLDDVYHDGPHVAPDDVITLDPAHVQVVEDALARGDAALRAFSPSTRSRCSGPSTSISGITLDEVNYGVSGRRRLLRGAVRLCRAVGAARRGLLERTLRRRSLRSTDLSDVDSVVDFFRDGSSAAEA